MAMTHNKPSPTPLTLEQLLRRGDVWRGQSGCLTPQATLGTGHAVLNQSLLNQGWPLATLIEVCQPSICGYSEWLLLAPALRQLHAGYIILLNPPAIPFAAGLIQMGLDLDRLLIVQTQNKAEFLASFVELARADICAALLAWQPKQHLNYTELRKCLLATADGCGLHLLFRPADMQRQSSPAALRILTQLNAQTLQVNIFKQKGWLAKNGARTVQLTLPEIWLPLVHDMHLDQAEEYTGPSSKPEIRRSQP
jgi:protein ImuA